MSDQPPNLDKYKAAFQPDGFLRHVCVENISLELWQRYYRFLCKTEAGLRFYVDGQNKVLPRQLDESLFLPNHNSVLIISLANIELSCTLSNSQSLRIDFAPDAIRTDDELRLILRIMSTLGRRMKKTSVLCHENGHDIYLKYSWEEGWLLPNGTGGLIA